MRGTLRFRKTRLRNSVFLNFFSEFPLRGLADTTLYILYTGSWVRCDGPRGGVCEKIAVHCTWQGHSIALQRARGLRRGRDGERNVIITVLYTYTCTGAHKKKKKKFRRRLAMVAASAAVASCSRQYSSLSPHSGPRT